MSRIGRNPIKIPQGVTVDLNEKERSVTVKGFKGDLSIKLRPEVDVVLDGDQLKVLVKSDLKRFIPFWGLTRALLANMVKGVTEGFEKKLELVGVGYRAKQNGNNGVILNLGFSHPVEFVAPEGIEIQVTDNQHITVKGIDSQLVGLTAANIRKIRKPEPYKGKGVRYEDEVVRRKAGKTGKVGA